jgi:hypothetical protein
MRDGYWCENVARSPDAGTEWLLGCYRAASPSDAMRWLRRQATTVAHALDPQPGTGPFPASSLRVADPDRTHVGRVFQDWLRDSAYQGIQQQALQAGQHISANAGIPDRIFGRGSAYVYVSLSCRPLINVNTTQPADATEGTAAEWWSPYGGTLDVPSGVVFIPTGANPPPCPFPCTRCKDSDR